MVIYLSNESSLIKRQKLNSLPNDKNLDWFKLKVFADDKFKVTKMLIFVFDSVENIVEKNLKKNAWFSKGN